MIKAVIIMGATASGKSSIALKAAERFGGEIVSADSMQIYRRMNIGTAKPTPDEQAKVRHHLIDIREPWESYSAADFVTDANSAVYDIIARKRLPIICGGTGLYLEGLIYPTEYEQTQTDEQLRKRLLLEDKHSLWQKLNGIDPESAAKIHENNVKRVVRALEIYYLTGSTKTELDRKQKNTSAYRSDLLLLTTDTSDREALYNRINTRVDSMISDGLLEETRELLNRGDLREGTTAYQAIGYKELIGYINGQTDLEDAVSCLKQATRNYAKRQITWFSRYNALPVKNAEQACTEIEKHLALN